MHGWFSRYKTWLAMLALVLALVLTVGGVRAYQIFTMLQGFKSQGVQQQTVSTMKAAYQDWQPQLSAVGTLRAEQGSDLSAEVAGIVDAIDFRSGDDVKAGQRLLQLRAADDAAHLESLRANAGLAETTYNRDKQQLQAEAVSQAALDADAANLRNARAQVAEQEAQLDKKQVRAPFAGHLGIRAVDLGQYLAAGTKIVTLQKLDPIYVDFHLPQQALGQVAVGRAVTAVCDASPGKTYTGRVDAIDPQVDVDTRNVQLRASLSNPEHKLLPGMYAKVTVETGQSARYLTLPLNAITFNPYGEAVFVVTTAGKLQAERQAKAGRAAEDTTPGAGEEEPPLPAQQPVVKQVFVTVGPTRGDQVAILKGVAEGDEVVTSGQMKIKTGSAVDVNNTVQPANEPDPKPSEDRP